MAVGEKYYGPKVVCELEEERAAIENSRCTVSSRWLARLKRVSVLGLDNVPSNNQTYRKEVCLRIFFGRLQRVTKLHLKVLVIGFDDQRLRYSGHSPQRPDVGRVDPLASPLHTSIRRGNARRLFALYFADTFMSHRNSGIRT